MAANGDDQENHWPGYVDALTTMTMVLTFVMMVLGISIFTLSQNVSRTLIEKIAVAAEVKDDPGGAEADTLAERILARIETLQHNQSDKASRTTDPTETNAQRAAASAEDQRHDRVISDAKAQAETPSSAQRLDAADAMLRIVYQPRSTQLDDNARQDLVAKLRAIPDLTTSRIEVMAGIDPANIAVSDAKRVAFYRAVRARSELIQQGVTADRIQVRIDNGTPGEDVVIRVKRPG
jgi:signal transduction histidine kinase